MAANLGLYELLMDALQSSRPGMALDDPAQVARHYPQGDDHLNGSASEAKTGFALPVEVSPRDESIRQLSLAPFATQSRTPAGSGAPSTASGSRWTASSHNTGLTASDGGRSTLPWWAPPPPPVMLGPGGRLGWALRGLGGPLPPAPADSPKIPMPEMPPALRLWWEMLKMYPEFHRKLYFPRGLDESEDANSSAAAPTDYYSEKKRGPKPKRDRPEDIPDAPSIVPSIPDDTSYTPKNEISRPIKTEEECEKEEQEAYKFCKQARKNGWNGPFSVSGEIPREDWDIEVCMKGQMSPECGGDPIKTEPDKKSKKRK